MKNEIKVNTLIRLKTFDVSIGRDVSEIAIISKSSGNFCNLSQTKKSKKLAKVKKEFRLFINSNKTFTFSYMNLTLTEKLINILNK